MSVVVPKWRFTETMVADAPDYKGVYVLWANGVPLAVGHARGGADTIRSRLAAHLGHGTDAGVRQVTHYSWEICGDPLKREAEVAEALELRTREREHEQRPQPLCLGPREARAEPPTPWDVRESS
jgi:hypothetical protein